MADTYKIQLIVEALNRAKGVFNDLSNDFKSQWKNADNFKLKMTELDGFLKAGIGIGALYGLTRGIKEAIDTAEKMQNSLRGLAAIARYSGEDIGASMKAASALAADGLVDVQSSAQALQNLLSRGFSLQEAVTMLERLKDAAAFNRQASLSMSDAVRSATEGLKNENSILVDNAGVTKNVSVMWKEYALSVGKTADSLTQAEKRQAEFNGIMLETEGQVGNAKLAMEGITGTKAELAVVIKKLSTAFGTSLIPAFIGLAKAGLWVLDNFVKPFLGGIEIMGAKLAMFSMKTAAIADWIASGFSGGVTELKRQFKIFDDVMDEQAAAIIKKYEGGIEVPALGKDTGKRRKDVVLPDNGKSAKKEADAWKNAQEAMLRYQLSLIDMQEQEMSISKTDAIEKRIGLYTDMLSVQEHYAKQIDRLKDPGGWNTQQKEIDKTRQHLLKLSKELREQTASFGEGFAKGFQQYLYEAQTAFQQGVEMAQQTAKAMESAFSDFFFDIMSGKLKHFSDYVKSFLQSIARAIAQMYAQQAAAGIVGSFSGTSTSSTVQDSGGYLVNVPTKHSGGLIMHKGGYVPRFHFGGLMSDERPAILQTGEGVLSRKGMAALDALNSGQAAGGGVSVVVNVENKSSQAVKATQGPVNFDAAAKSLVVGVFLEDMEYGGPMRKSIEGVKR